MTACSLSYADSSLQCLLSDTSPFGICNSRLCSQVYMPESEMAAVNRAEG